jgi:hypothetical protein
MAPMRTLFRWIAGLAGIAALARLLASRQPRPAAPLPPAAGPEPDPAEALRRKLTDARSEPVSPSATPEDDGPTETLDARRARIHAKAQEAIEAMQEPPS